MRVVWVALAAATATAGFSADAPNICSENATIAAHVLDALNLTYPGLEAVAAAAAAGDSGAACAALAAYYATSASGSWWRQPAPTPSSRLAGGYADAAVFHDTYWLAGVQDTVIVPRNADGGYVWTYKGTMDDVEVMNCINRHDVFGWLLSAWASTGNPIYPAFYDSYVRDWALHLPCPGADLRGAPACSPQGLPGAPCSWGLPPGAQACATGTMESPWRTLEQGIRMGGVWGEAFYGFQAAANFSVSARVLAVLVAAENNAALLRYTSTQGTPNWIITQWSGLAMSAVSWPELKNASGLLAVAVSGLHTMLSSQVYPDGVETEQAAGYDMVTASDYFSLLATISRGGGSVDPSFIAAVEQMWAYGSYVSDPDGFLPRNGDTDLMDSGYSATAAQYFKRPDWDYIHSNGAAGTKPSVTSIVFPWAGQAVFRSGYDKNATWAWFDVGPYGSSGHADRDKLQVVLHARGAMFLIDSGRFEYSGDTFSNTLHRLYKGLTHAHNTLTIDGAEQQAAPAVADAPLPPESYSIGADLDSAFASMSLYDPAVLNGSATHTRGVVYAHAPAGAADGDFLVVVDRVAGDRPRALMQSWHAHPNASVAVAADGSLTVEGAARATGLRTGAVACVVPIATPAFSWQTPTVVVGANATASNGNQYQGWVSFIYNDALPAPAVVYSAAGVPSGTVFGWVIYPQTTAVAGGCAAAVSGTLVSGDAAGAIVRVTVPGAAPRDVTVPLA